LLITYTHDEKDVKWNMFRGNQKHKQIFVRKHETKT